MSWSPSITTTKEALFRPKRRCWSHCSWTGVPTTRLLKGISICLCGGPLFVSVCLSVTAPHVADAAVFKLFSTPPPSPWKPLIHLSRLSWGGPQEASLGRSDWVFTSCCQVRSYTGSPCKKKNLLEEMVREPTPKNFFVGVRGNLCMPWLVFEGLLKLWGENREHAVKKGTGCRIPKYLSGYFSCYKKFDIFWKIEGIQKDLGRPGPPLCGFCWEVKY